MSLVTSQDVRHTRPEETGLPRRLNRDSLNLMAKIREEIRSSLVTQISKL